jgi:protein-S-isoprenylcysteine O-methyltransferase Ste14
VFLIRWLVAVLVLPCTALVLLPSLLLWWTCAGHWADCLPSASSPRVWTAIVLVFLGAALAVWTMSLFFRFGEGTAAPWDPPRRFVVRGPYRFVRNPMMLGAFLILAAEAVFFGSLAIFALLCIFVLGNAIYIPLVEEPALVRRFGRDYEVFRENVPRWIPRISAWRPE